MFRFTPGVAGGFAVGFAAAFATIFAIATTTPSVVVLHSDKLKLDLPPSIVLVDRSAKADRGRLNVAEDQTLQKRIVTVEVIGLSNAAIVYKNNDGQVLYSTDPVANVTVVAKNLTLPEVTIRETNGSIVDQVPLERTRAPGPKSPITVGCESGLSPDISPTVPIESSRCIAQIGKPSKVASLN